MWERDVAKQKKKSEPTGIRHNTPKCQREAIMRIRKMQALRNEMPEQNSQDGSHGAFRHHVSARWASPPSSVENKLGIAATGRRLILLN